jgi:general secretion pathway protein A
MYKDYFCLKEMPFSIAPDPRFLYRSVRHREALAHLLYGVQGDGGIVLLTGEVGTGKTTICRCLLEEIQSSCDVAYILNPRLSAKELLAAICDEFHVERPTGAIRVKGLVDAINAHLLQANARERRAVLIIDEAQNLQPDVLEQLRLLTNLETNTRKLLQIILIGQPELKDMLHRPELRQVAQRVVARYHLTHLTRDEVAHYVAHRLAVAGARAPIFRDALIGTLYRVTGGVPRLINLVCDRALLGTSVQGMIEVTPRTLRSAAREVLATSGSGRFRWRRSVGWLFLCAAVLFAGGVFAASLLAFPLWPLDWIGPQLSNFASALVRPEKVAEVPRLAPGARVAAGAADARAVAAADAKPAVAAQGLPVPLAAAAGMAEVKGTAALDGTAAGSAVPQGGDQLSWPESVAPRARSEAIAFRDLLRLRGLEFDPGDKRAPCKVAETYKLRCQYGRSGVGELRRVNQPAVLRIDGEGRGKEYYAVVTGLNDHAATMIVAGETRRVPLAQLAQLWSGMHLYLWSAPPGYAAALAPGSRGPSVEWLRQTLAQLQGGNPEGAAVFDEELTRRVKAFQFSEGLAADGVAGEMTLMRMSQRLDHKWPRLARSAGEG